MNERRNEGDGGQERLGERMIAGEWIRILPRTHNAKVLLALSSCASPLACNSIQWEPRVISIQERLKR